MTIKSALRYVARLLDYVGLKQEDRNRPRSKFNLLSDELVDVADAYHVLIYPQTKCSTALSSY